mmetsp:Transcript_15493/g.16789  ORF Transcript_15493/g.16789 Transcript_15493/m.16789 type:complete len:457 (+) Transcript_15493:23-1393(+)
MDYGGSFQQFLQFQDHFHQLQSEEKRSRELLIEHWNKLKSDIEGGQERLNSYIDTLNELSWGKDLTNAVDYDGFNERVRISLAGSFYEVKRGALVQDPAIGWNRLSCLFKKRWEKFLLCDKNGRIYFDYESEWMKPILQALKGEVDIVLNKSANNVSAWYGILSRFQLQENIKFNLTNKDSNREIENLRRVHNGYYTDPKAIKKVDVKPVTVSRTPVMISKKTAPAFGLIHSSGNAFLESNEVLQTQLSLLNQWAPLLSKSEDVLAEVQDNFRIFLEELKFMAGFLYSEWKDIIPSLPSYVPSGTTDVDGTEIEPIELQIQIHIQYFVTVFPIIQDYKHRVKSAASKAERRQLDCLAYFNVEGERMVIKKYSLVSIFEESQLAVRLSGRWTEQLDDVDEEGNIYYDVSSAAFRALFQFVRIRVLVKDGQFTFVEEIKPLLKSLIDYFAINKKKIPV